MENQHAFDISVPLTPSPIFFLEMNIGKIYSSAVILINRKEQESVLILYDSFGAVECRSQQTKMPLLGCCDQNNLIWEQVLTSVSCIQKSISIMPDLSKIKF